MLAYAFGFVSLERTGMGLLFGNADFGQYIQNGLALNFQFSCEIVDSNLTHPSYYLLRFPLSFHCNLTEFFKSFIIQLHEPSAFSSELHCESGADF